MMYRSCRCVLAAGLGALTWAARVANAAGDLDGEPVVRHGWLLVSEEEWMDVAVVKAGYFRRAHDCFLDGNRQDAAREIRAKATLVRIESRRAVDQARTSLPSLHFWTCSGGSAS